MMHTRKRTCTDTRVRTSGSSIQPPSSSSAAKNVETIAFLEQTALHERSLTDRVSDEITRFAGSGVFIVLHVIWFSVWVLVNCGKIRIIEAFDPFPFTFLTMVVSLEAIFLSIFVLISQNGMTRQGDRRAHLDLQINLLAEQENTMMLRMLKKLCERQGIEPETLSDDVESLVKKTDLHKLMGELREKLPES